MMEFKNNPTLKNIYPENFKGSPVNPDGTFKNIGIPYIPGFRDAIKWKSRKNPMAEQKKTDTWRPEVIYGDHFLHEKQDCIVWLGHASFYLHLHGKKILIDPVIENVTFLKRLISPPCPTSEFKNIDYLLLSHNHRDHCDANTLKIVSSNNPHIKIFTGLGVENNVKKWFPKNEIQSAGWFQQYEIKDAEIKITYVPSRHWSKRWLNDDNKSLWGGFVIQFKDKTIYFMGDSGYGDHFKMIADLFPEPDICIMGVGAFMPEWFMGPSHISPTNAVRAFNEMKGKKMIPMHYGTFDLSDEPVGEPIRILKAIEKQNEINGQLVVLKAGEILHA
ncbi:MAG: MBL fold metallo-hydrolase [Bacteroidia bacterium]|nr:MBL fold metallo-hydrolase [Bacteroidia bacterium]